MKFCVCCKLLQMLCFPPCPRNIIEHAAFQPPPPTYKIYFNSESSKYTFYIDKECEIQNLSRLAVPLEDIELTFTTTKYNTKIVCMYYAVRPPSSTTILYSHGNGSDLGSVVGLCVLLANRVHCNMLIYDYSGYGRSTGRPSEKRLYGDIEAAFDLLLKKYNCSPDDVVLFGQSLGSAPTLDLASRVKVRGVVVQSGFASALNVAFTRADPRQMCCDVFENIQKVGDVTSPVLVIHGTADDVIDLSHGEAIYERCPFTVDPLWIEGAGHNDVELYPQYLRRLKYFLSVELPQIHKSDKESLPKTKHKNSAE